MLREIAREARAAGAEGESATLPLKIERSVRSGRTRSRRARLSDLPMESLRVPPDMNANVALLEPEAQAAPCAEKLSEINESLRARERLLTASATASRLLLEAPDVRAAIPRVLGLIVEAAHVDRVSVMETRTGPQGEPLLVVVSEWTGPGVTPYLHDTCSFSCDERDFSSVFAQLRAGRSVCLSPSETPGGRAAAGIEGVDTKTKAIVPIFVASEFIGVVGFDNTRQQRAIDASELAALETAAGVIGAALHRERLVRSEEHTSELQSPCNLVCRLLLEKKKKNISTRQHRSATPTPYPFDIPPLPQPHVPASAPPAIASSASLRFTRTRTHQCPRTASRT